MKALRIYISILILPALISCENYFGTKTDLDFIEIPEYTNRDVAYVPIEPALTGFIKPIDICIGYDELIYVVDEASEEIICFDESARELGRFRLQGVKAVVQDRSFDLLAIGTFDTVINTVNYSLTAIYRINQFRNGVFGLKNAIISNKIVHPFYFKNSFSTSDADVRFNGIGIVGDDNNPTLNNRYYVTRKGPSSNNANQGPDDAVVMFNNQDNYISPIAVSTSSGLFNDYFQDPFGITTWCQPPQITASTSPDFIYTSLDPNNLLKVQYIEFIETEFGADFRPVIFPVDDPLATGYLYTPGKFTEPTGITVAGDDTRYIFVADAAKDSVFQFTSNGLEGIPPPPGSEEQVYQKASFGGTGVGPTQFNRPVALAYFKEILYVVDSENGRVTRFKLTLDFD